MIEWDMYLHFAITFFSVIGLLILAWLITRYALDDYSDEDAIDDAEWIIIDNCNGKKNCEECSCYIVESKCCKYNKLPPWQWRKSD